MSSKVLAWSARIAGLCVIAAALLVALRAFDAQRGPPLSIWHTHVPQDLNAAAIDQLDWPAYLQAERQLVDAARSHVAAGLSDTERLASNRYFEASPLNPGRFATDWNRSFVMEPATTPRGAVVLLHGLTDSPYSLRHIAQRYREQGWLALAIRLPAHGTVPGALTDVAWQDWSAAARLALREARRRIGPSQPLHLVGYSNGGALAMKLALDALDDSRLPRAERIVLVSPMIGITGFARFAGVLGWPAVFPAFANTAWLNVLPEYNPFKYNSFPVNGARQSSLLTRALQAQIAARARDGRLAELPPVLSFQSIADYTVSTTALVNALYAQLPANGSELVVFDVNRGTHLSALLRSNTETAFDSLVGKAPRRYRATLVTNAAAEGDQVVERVTPALATSEQVRALGLAYPRELYSLSHVALPFPASDGLYGTQPSPQDDFGVQLGTMAARGEVGVLIVGLDTVFRASSNPFFEFMMQRVDAGIAASMARKAGG